MSHQRDRELDRRTFLGSSTLGLASLGTLGRPSPLASTHGESDEPMTVRDLRTGEKPVRDVRAYGAVGDGETDDTAAFQDAFDGALDGDAIYVPPGEYRCTEQITQDDKAVSLRGAGAAVSEIVFDTADGGFDLDIPRPTDDAGEVTHHPNGSFLAADLSLVTTEAGGGTALDVSWPHVGSSLYVHAIIQNVQCIGTQRAQTGWSDGVVLDESWHTAIDGLVFVGAGSEHSGAAVELRGRSIANVLRQVVSYHATDGVLLNGRTEGFRMSQSDFVATRYGLRSGPEQTAIPQVVCVDAHANVSGIAIDLENTSETYIAGCDLWTWQWSPDGHTDPVIRLSGNTDARITNNVLRASGSGIEIESSDRTYIGGNTIGADNETEGIRVNYSRNTVVSGNQIEAESAEVDGIVCNGGRLLSVVGNVLHGTGEGVRFGEGVNNAIAGINLWNALEPVDADEVVIDAGTNTLVSDNLGAGFAAPDEEEESDSEEANGTDDDSTPGFGIGAAAVGLGGVSMALAARNGRQETN